MRCLILILIMSIFVGCEHVQEKKLDPNYSAYVAAYANRQPLLDLVIDDQGKIKRITVGQQTDIAPYVPSYHPAWKIFGNAITVIGGIVAGGWAIHEIVNGNGASGYGYPINNNTTTTTTTDNSTTVGSGNTLKKGSTYRLSPLY